MDQNLVAIALAGFALGASLIIAIGAQNAFVLKLGIQRRHVFVVVMICAISDAILIAAGVGGFGSLVQSLPKLLLAVAVVGSIFLFVYGALAFRRAFSPHALNLENSAAPGLWSSASMALGLTFLNPHVYLDTVVLLGGLSGQYAGEGRIVFALGAIAASFVWFFALGYGARMLAPIFEKPLSWKILDFIIGLVMWTIAGRLIYSHFQF